MKHGWKGILALSTAIWGGAQLGFGAGLYARFAAATHFPVPIKETGSFAITAWQFLWVLGLWMGSGLGVRGEAENPVPRRFPRWMVAAAIVYALGCLAARHRVGRIPFPGAGESAAGNLLFDKWTLGPLRMLDLLSMLLLAPHSGRWLVAHLPRMTFLETLGRRRCRCPACSRCSVRSRSSVRASRTGRSGSTCWGWRAASAC